MLYWIHRIDLFHRRCARARAEHKAPPQAALAADACAQSTGHAVAVLTRAVREALVRAGSQPHPRFQTGEIDWEYWIHATCSLRAESAICATLAAAAGDEYHTLAEAARTLYEDMARVDVFNWWLVTVDPLYRAWLDGPLCGASSPPQLLRDRQALYEAYPALADGWDLQAGLSAGDCYPLGSLERYVPDSRGDWWAIIIAAPDFMDDPRDWPEPTAAVVASRVPTGTTDASSCYVLANAVHARRALTTIARGRENDRLEDLATLLYDKP
ncbi:hypothetical protein [Kitasatospora sp. NPDC059827]|uniref:hypothetical protein n=1 Tax=Kitasatospora sp. NPDC059827 TaxID=3346964 RepID=UPI0036518F36